MDSKSKVEYDPIDDNFMFESSITVGETSIVNNVIRSELPKENELSVNVNTSFSQRRKHTKNTRKTLQYLSKDNPYICCGEIFTTELEVKAHKKYHQTIDNKKRNDEAQQTSESNTLDPVINTKLYQSQSQQSPISNCTSDKTLPLGATQNSSFSTDVASLTSNEDSSLKSLNELSPCAGIIDLTNDKPDQIETEQSDQSNLANKNELVLRSNETLKIPPIITFTTVQNPNVNGSKELQFSKSRKIDPPSITISPTNQNSCLNGTQQLHLSEFREMIQISNKQLYQSKTQHYPISGSSSIYTSKKTQYFNCTQKTSFSTGKSNSRTNKNASITNPVEIIDLTIEKSPKITKQLDQSNVANKNELAFNNNQSLKTPASSTSSTATQNLSQNGSQELQSPFSVCSSNLANNENSCLLENQQLSNAKTLELENSEKLHQSKTQQFLNAEYTSDLSLKKTLDLNDTQHLPLSSNLSNVESNAKLNENDVEQFTFNTDSSKSISDGVSNLGEIQQIPSVIVNSSESIINKKSDLSDSQQFSLSDDSSNLSNDKNTSLRDPLELLCAAELLVLSKGEVLHQTDNIQPILPESTPKLIRIETLDFNDMLSVLSSVVASELEGNNICNLSDTQQCPLSANLSKLESKEQFNSSDVQQLTLAADSSKMESDKKSNSSDIEQFTLSPDSSKSENGKKSELTNTEQFPLCRNSSCLSYNDKTCTSDTGEFQSLCTAQSLSLTDIENPCRNDTPQLSYSAKPLKMTYKKKLCSSRSNSTLTKKRCLDDDQHLLFFTDTSNMADSGSPVSNDTRLLESPSSADLSTLMSNKPDPCDSQNSSLVTVTSNGNYTENSSLDNAHDLQSSLSDNRSNLTNGDRSYSNTVQKLTCLLDETSLTGSIENVCVNNTEQMSLPDSILKSSGIKKLYKNGSEQHNLADPPKNVLGRSSTSNKKSIVPKTVYKCDKCDISFFSKRVLATHNKSHANKNVHRCNTCQFSSTSSSQFKLHTKSHISDKVHSCKICDKIFCRKINLTYHLKTHSEQKKQFKCNQCEQSFVRNHYLTLHAKTHSKSKLYKCTECKVAFKQKLHFLFHVSTHSVNKSNECNLCMKMFQSAVSLKRHLIMHSKEISFQCNTCKKYFCKKSLLISHIHETCM